MRGTTWITLVMQADPEHAREKRNVVEYEFSAKGGGSEKTHRDGQRVFRGDYGRRGPYAEPPNALLAEDGTPLRGDQGGYLRTEDE